MVTGDIKQQVDRVWNAFWSGGVSNPLTVIEQITYLLFAKRLDELEMAEEAKAKQDAKKQNGEKDEQPPTPGKEADELAHELEQQIKASKMPKDLKGNFTKKLKPLWEKGDMEGLKKLAVKIEVEANKAAKNKK